MTVKQPTLRSGKPVIPCGQLQPLHHLARRRTRLFLLGYNPPTASSTIVAGATRGNQPLLGYLGSPSRLVVEAVLEIFLIT